MARAPKKNNMGVPSEIAKEMTQMAREEKLVKKASVGVPIPGGGRLELESFVDHDFRPDAQAFSVYADIEKHLKHPKPGCMYVWKPLADRRRVELMQGIRTGKYIPVTADDLKDDVDLPIESAVLIKGDTPAGNTHIIQIKDLGLVEVQPRAVAEDYKHREYMAAARTVPAAARAAFENRIGPGLISKGLIEFEAEEREYNPDAN